MRGISKRFATGLVWAMIPLTILGSLPRIGCICADGQRKLLCQRLFRTESSCKTSTGSCSCCHRSAAKNGRQVAKQSHVAGVKSCCAARQSHGSPLHGKQLGSGRCCTPEINVPLLPPVLDSGAAIPQSAPEFVLGEIDLPRPWTLSMSTEATWDHSLPVLDRVVTYRVLVI